MLHAYEGDHDGLVDHLLQGLATHTGSDTLAHDDVTIFVGEIVAGPPGPALWHVFRNRFGATRPVGNVRPVARPVAMLAEP